ncbi:MAG: hypothetical protein R6V83_08790 [Candidatus Thorarchaeota archaeon]
MNTIIRVEILRIKIKGKPTLYPEAAIRGRLRLSGLDHKATEQVLTQILRKLPEEKHLTEQRLFEILRDKLAGEAKKRFDTVTKYYSIRRNEPQVPPLFVAVEGASATGKSMLALELASILVTTRIIGTDTIRLLMRQQTDEKKHPELFCHTYQAHAYKRAGPDSLDRIVRGYLGQCNLMKPVIFGLTQRIIKEGASGLIEGVHIIPGQLEKLSDSIIEVVINPQIKVHKQMFFSKGITEKITTVDTDTSKREREFHATRKIQEFMLERAKQNGVSIIGLKNFEDATENLIDLLYDRVENIIGKYGTAGPRTG